MCCFVLVRCAAWDLIKALEREAAYYSDVLKGLQDSPHTEQWASLTQRYQQLQQQVTQQQERDVAPRELEATLAAGLQPCQVGPGCWALCSARTQLPTTARPLPVLLVSFWRHAGPLSVP